MTAHERAGTPKREHVYLLWNGELNIEAPPGAVWPHVLNYPEWQAFSIAQHVEGERHQEGEVVLLKKIEAGFDFPPYYARTIKVDPERRIIWKTYGHESSEMEFFGIVEFVLKETSRGTRFNYNILYEFVMEGSKEEVEEFRQQQFASSQAVFDSIFPKLKALAEN